jgi:hypothetical protein
MKKKARLQIFLFIIMGFVLIPTNSCKKEYTIGQSYGGGIVFYVDGKGQHGLISSTSDQSTGGVPWGCYGTLIGGTGTAIGTGQANTTAILNKCNTALAARICDDLVLNGYSDWFLPSKDELHEMLHQQSIIGGFYGASGDVGYWSSSESGKDFAWLQYFGTINSQYGVNKEGSLDRVRAVRAF